MKRKTAPPLSIRSQPRSDRTVVKTCVKPTSRYHSQSVYSGTAWPTPARKMKVRSSQRPRRGERCPLATDNLRPRANMRRGIAVEAALGRLGAVGPGGEVLLLGGR